jgi:hypothetical protein
MTNYTIIDRKSFNTIPDVINWDGIGEAFRLPERGMSDYQRGNGNAIYETADKHRLHMKGNKWKAQYKCITTGWFDSAEEAIIDFDSMVREIKNYY